jgi:hypothetical protein
MFFKKIIESATENGKKKKADDEMLFYHVLASMLLLLLFEKMKYLVWCLRWDFLSSKIMSHILAPPIQCRLDKNFPLLNNLSDSSSTLGCFSLIS